MVEKKTRKKVAKKGVKKSTKKSTKKVAKKAVPVTKEESPQKKSFAGTIALISMILVILLILGALVLVPKYSAKKQLTDDMYNNFQFKEWEDGFWTVNVEVNAVPYSILLYHHAREVDYIPLDQKAVDLINGIANQVQATGNGTLYLTMNPQAPAGIGIAGVELAKILGQKFDIYNIPITAAFSRPLANNSNIPVVTCEDAVDDVFVIYLRESEPALVGVPDGFDQCIVVQGSDANETIMAADRLIYGLFTIIPAN